LKKVYSAESGLEVAMIKGMLEQEGINCLLKNHLLSGALGEIPAFECWPELWITDDNDLSLARDIVAAAISPLQPSSGFWHCACGEKLEAQFSACWKCGEEKPQESR
jgi:putative signal transducing protein